MNAAVATNLESVQVTPLSAFIGAEISGVDLSEPLDTHQVVQIRAALLRWRVIFFREQFEPVSRLAVFGHRPIYAFRPQRPGHPDDVE